MRVSGAANPVVRFWSAVMAVSAIAAKCASVIVTSFRAYWPRRRRESSRPRDVFPLRNVCFRWALLLARCFNTRLICINQSNSSEASNHLEIPLQIVLFKHRLVIALFLYGPRPLRVGCNFLPM
ncbi:hypothetical protein QBC42DRAFT_273113 [Cladorrhinum samala]|uniref:Secreted protein n=1 Tax=Cladorrhinum samala TaxID=585594 RepID=A0AAV9HH66_9PEZI|nr:hypothetical protein QBC42DRAFT_273113 [Cladorrhinum samala]